MQHRWQIRFYMCETHKLYVFLARSCLLVCRAPKKIRHINMVQVLAETALSSKRGTHLFALNAVKLAVNKTISLSLSFPPFYLLPPLSSSPTSSSQVPIFLEGSLFFHGGVKAGGTRQEGLSILLAIFTHIKQNISGQCYKYRYYRICFNPHSF